MNKYLPNPVVCFVPVSIRCNPLQMPTVVRASKVGSQETAVGHCPPLFSTVSYLRRQTMECFTTGYTSKCAAVNGSSHCPHTHACTLCRYSETCEAVISEAIRVQASKHQVLLQFCPSFSFSLSNPVCYVCVLPPRL